MIYKKKANKQPLKKGEIQTQYSQSPTLQTLKGGMQEDFEKEMDSDNDSYSDYSHIPDNGELFPEKGNNNNEGGNEKLPPSPYGEVIDENNSHENKGRKKRSSTPALDTFGTDLTDEAKKKKFDPLVGRENEIMRIIHILSRRKKNNPVLIGDPGVGKSAIVEGLAQRIVEMKVPLSLLNKRIVRLDSGNLVAGTKFRGEFEDRINKIVKEVKSDPNIILFIDEIHSIIGTGSAENSPDMANLLKPALARGEISCIGATTLDEYEKSIEKDGALERRFQKVMVAQNTSEETLEILEQLKKTYEDFHSVTYTSEALKSAVELTGRYVQDRFFPDKAIDAIDEAGAGASLQSILPPEEIELLEKEIAQYREARNKAVSAMNYELAASFRDKEREVEQKRNDLLHGLKDNRKVVEVDSNMIAQTVGRMTGIPMDRLAKTESRRLRELDKVLKKKVIGQDPAIEKVTKAIQRNRLGLGDPKRPIGSFLFLGSTGVGKTFLAKKIAEELFGDEKSLIRFDMSEFSESYKVSRLIGSSPGYIGYEEGGELTKKVKRRPYSVLLLDEIEKAHPDIFNVLLQVLDDGILTDNFGKNVDFKNTVIIMTGNIGSRKLNDFGKGIGFRTEDNEESQNNEIAKSIIDKELKRTFSPEFLNRLDGIVHFNSLSKESIRIIVDNRLSEIQSNIESKGYGIDVSNEVKDYLADKGYSQLYGARPLNRLLQSEIEDVVTDYILDEKINVGEKIAFTMKDGKTFTEVVGISPEKNNPIKLNA